MLWVDKHRPSVLKKMDIHSDLSKRLGVLVCPPPLCCRAASRRLPPSIQPSTGGFALRPVASSPDCRPAWCTARWPPTPAPDTVPAGGQGRSPAHYLPRSAGRGQKDPGDGAAARGLRPRRDEDQGGELRVQGQARRGRPPPAPLPPLPPPLAGLDPPASLLARQPLQLGPVCRSVRALFCRLHIHVWCGVAWCRHRLGRRWRSRR